MVQRADWQKFAEPLLSSVALAYYASAGDDEISKCPLTIQRPATGTRLMM